MAPKAAGLGRWHRERCVDRARGFTLVEVMVAFSLLLVMLVPAIALMQHSVRVSGDVQNRIVSANLASEQLEVTRALQFPAIPKPPSPDQTWDREVGRTRYTVHQRTSWVSQSASAGPCGSTGNGTATLPPVLLVHVWVTWPAMGVTAPPWASTTITPTYGTYSADEGNIAVSVTDSHIPPQPVAGVPVSITDSSNNTAGPYLTDSTGCAFIAYLNPGAYTLTAHEDGYVGQQEETTAATPTPVTLVGGKTLGVALAYEPAATLAVGYPGSVPPPPANLAVTVANGLLKAPGTHTFTPAPGAVLSELSPLWAYSDGYSVWAGQCPDSQPAVAPPPAAVTQGASTPYTVDLHELDVTVVDATGTPVPNATVTAVDADPTCTTPATYVLRAETPPPAPPPTTTTTTTTVGTTTTTTAGTTTTTTVAPTTTVPPTTTTTLPFSTPGVSQTGMPLGRFTITATAPGFTQSSTATVVVVPGGPISATVTVTP